MATEEGQTGQHGEPGQRPNKYVYEEFAGYRGEEYLDTLLQQILPFALHRTWWYAVKHQAPGNECYVGTARIASRVKPGIRKIELDFQELEARGLMRKYGAYLPVEQEDGSARMCPVTIKDFRALYDLAHEYHLWLKSAEFIPPHREYREIIVANLKLLAKLVRFDCYRRIVECAKPGRKTQAQPQHYYYHYHCSQEAAGQATEAADSPRSAEEPPTVSAASPSGEARKKGRHSPDHRTPVQNANLYLNELDKTSAPYRESGKEEVLYPLDTDSNHYEEGFPATTIGNSSETETESRDETGTEETENWNESDSPSKSKTPNPTQKEGAGPARAIRVEEDETLNIEELKRDPYALATALAEMVINERQMLKAVKQPPRSDQRQRRGTPDQLQREIATITQKLGANPANLQSDMTRATKLYWTATQAVPDFQNSWFKKQLDEAYEKALHKRRCGNRIAYFFTCLENRLHLTPDERAYSLSEEPLYKDGLLRHFKNTLRREYARSGSTTEYNAWVRREILKEQPK